MLRRSTLLTVVLAFSLLLFGFITPTPAYAASISFRPACNPSGTNSTPLGTGIITPPGNYNTSLSVTNLTTSATVTQSGTATFPASFFSGPVVVNPGDVILVTIRIIATGESGFFYPCGGGPSSNDGVKFFDPGDDRLNREPGQPAALYCRNQGDVHIYAVNADDSKGKLALIVTKAEIDAVINGNPSANTLIKQSADGKFKLFYLPATKELSFITNEARSGKQYSFVWKGLCR